MKLKRRVIEQIYADKIEGLYADIEEPRPSAQPSSKNYNVSGRKL